MPTRPVPFPRVTNFFQKSSDLKINLTPKTKFSSQLIWLESIKPRMNERMNEWTEAFNSSADGVKKTNVLHLLDFMIVQTHLSSVCTFKLGLNRWGSESYISLRTWRGVGCQTRARTLGWLEQSSSSFGGKKNMWARGNTIIQPQKAQETTFLTILATFSKYLAPLHLNFRLDPEKKVSCWAGPQVGGNWL